VLDDPATRTRDIGGSLGTAAFTSAVVAALRDDLAKGPAA
jgi:3-isopropylmalate dehydrogenase